MALELRHLKYFVAVAEELNFHRAARRLHLSQPALSRQIQQLEDEIDVALFQRSAKRIDLTTAGRTLQSHAYTILAHVRKAEEQSRSVGKGEAGYLAIGFFGSAIFDVIPKLLLEYGRQHPNVKLQLFQMTKEAQIQALRDRELTIGFNRMVPPQSDIVQRVVLTEDMMVAIPSAHPLARQRRIDCYEVLNEPMVLYPRWTTPGLGTRVYEIFDAYNAQPNVVQEVTDVATAMALVAGGFGLSIVPQSASHLRLPGIVYRPLIAKVAAKIELVCLYRRDDHSPILRSFLEVLQTLTSRDAETAEQPSTQSA
ncbi:LysR family transcriptional regulator [Burkholderia lata]|uniref:LysR family transcriptional regulator n=1 Tax=Burkholderia lata (strain ATCC 17760 / DSM 23089 / LMG 22485 / NCIMB 9086 / R18194 / 383) TaxID=482957 RepID=UPI001452C54F|nr:LysR family transcriptional regulator [Burkholderia lata]VWB44279.1 transcriptional regulator CatR [Burkholderia lata]